MGRKQGSQRHTQAEIVSQNKSTETANTSNGSQSPPAWLMCGSHVPRARTNRSWKEKCTLLREENKELREKLKRIQDEQYRLQQISKDHAARFFQFQNSDNVQIGDHNLQIVNNSFDATFLKELLDQYEDKIKEDARERKSLKEEIKLLSTRIMELTETHKRSEQMLDRAGLTDHLKDLHQLADPKLACPVSSIAMMSKQATDLVKNFTPEIMHLQDSIRSLRSYIDEPKLEFLMALCSSQRSLSTLSLDDKRLTRSYDKCQCQKRINSEININMHV